MDKKDTMTLHEVLKSHKYEQGGHVDLTSMERQFIRKYKQLSFLWNPNHPDYNNKLKRNAGYDSLMPIFRKYMPKATRFHIRQKINILRSCYRKERRKYLSSSSIDPEGNVVYSYIPTTWKFEALKFLDDDVDHEMDASEMESYPEYEDEQELEYIDTAEIESGNEDGDTSKFDITPIYLEEHLEDQKPYKRKRQKKSYNTYEDISLESYVEGDVLEKEFNAIGANVACKLQRMSVQQRYHAELLINKVLIQGLKENLTEYSDLTSSWHKTSKDSLSYKSKNDKEDYCINTSSKDYCININRKDDYCIDTSNKEDYCITSKDDSREDPSNASLNHSDEMSEDK